LYTAQNRETPVTAGSCLWRSQLGNDWRPEYQEGEYIDDIPYPFTTQRMIPLKNEASEGRANPKGIPFLYLATDKETAMSEVRPWVGSLISVGQFKTLRDLRLIDCTKNHQGMSFFIEEPDPQTREQVVWSHIDHAFSKPVNPSDSVAEYVPTHIIAELFKIAGYDGIIYKSSLEGGFNVVLFDIESAEIINCFLFKVKTISFIFEKTANSYFLNIIIYNISKNSNPQQNEYFSAFT
jgi:RES domain-containing protein